jgi:3-oxoacyl-[acyl-carrier-protein] synthase-1
VVCAAGGNSAELWESVVKERSSILDGLALVRTHHKNAALELARESAEQALTQAGWDSLGADDGLIVGTTTGQIQLWEGAYMDFSQKKLSEFELKAAFEYQRLGAFLERFADTLKFRGRKLVVAPACTAATQAIALGKAWIDQGLVRRCLVGGVEVLSRLTIDGFGSLQLLSKNPATPFDRDRAGINLAEAGAFICLQKASAGQFEVELSGAGWGTDAHHMTAPEPQGSGIGVAMRGAVHSAGLDLSDISWIHAHGTGSVHNDLAEGHAIRNLFGEHAPLTSSTKWIHGHSLGASGALEGILCIEALKRQTILRTSGLKNPDPLIELRHPEAHRSYPLKHVIKNSLGFGGVNTSILLSRGL